MNRMKHYRAIMALILLVVTTGWIETPKFEDRYLPIAPYGSQIYGRIEKYTPEYYNSSLNFTYAGNQNLTVIAYPSDPGQVLTVSLYYANTNQANRLAIKTAQSAGDPVDIQSVPLVLTGTYIIKVIQQSSGSSGNFTLHQFLNTEMEVEKLLPTEVNNTTAASQPLSAGWLSFGRGMRTAVLGEIGLETDEDFYSIDLAEQDTLEAVINTTTNGPLSLQALDPDGVPVGTVFKGSLNASQRLFFQAQSMGTYHISVRPAEGTAPHSTFPAQYALLLTRNAILEREPNNDLSSSQPIDRSNLIFGSTGVPPSLMNSPQFVQAHAAPFNLGFSVSGAFCEPTGPTCIEYDGTKFLLDPPAQFAGFAIEADGDSIIYSTASPGASMETYDFANGNRKMVIFEGKNDTGIHFRRTYFWITGNGWQPEPQPGIIQITTEITNHSGSALQGLELVEVLDPVIGGQDSTYNEVLSGGTAVTASGAENGYTLLLGSPDPRASVAVDTIAVLDPDLVLNSTYLPDSLVAEDKNLGLAFDLGMLENGARATANYFIIVAPQKAKVVQSYTNSEMDRRLGSPDDFYQLSLSDGQRLIATTTTPYQANLNYRNEFNPYLVLYNQIGEVVASDDNSAGDNRNAQLVYDVPPGSGGDYRLVISASTELVANRLPHGSEYVLSIELPNPPVLEAIPSPVGVRQMTTWYISPTATDPDLPDDLLVFSLVNPPAGMTISPSDGFTSWTPGKEVSPQTYTFIMRVTDSTGLSDEQALGINVLPLLQTFLPAVVVGH